MPDTITLWAAEFDVAEDAATISFQQTITVEQARRLQALVPEALSPQEAIRMVVAQGLMEREQLRTRSDVSDAVDALQRIDSRLAEHESSE